MITLIAAIAENFCIGKDNKLPWNIPEDLAYFKKMTTNKTVLMGRKTWDSIPKKIRPLPNRKNIVISRQQNLLLPKDVILYNSLKSALRIFKNNDIYVIGGAGIYEQTINIADTLYITHVHQIVDGDTFFPKIKKNEWKEIWREDHEKFSFVKYTRN